MDLFFDLLYKFMLTLMMALGVWLASRFTLSLGVSFSIAAIIGITYMRVIFPLIDPLRKYPLIEISDMRVLLPVTDVPRGESALKWTKQFPGVDLIRIRVMGNTTTLMPMSPAALRDILATNEADFEKPTGGRNFLSRILGYGLILSEGPSHTRQRKHLTSSFRIQNIRALHELMLTKAQVFSRNMKTENDRHPDTGVDITKWGSRVTLDIIGEALMSTKFDSLEVDSQPVNEAFSGLLTSTPGITSHFMLSLILPKWVVASLPSATNAMMHRNIRIIRESCQAALAAIRNEAATGAASRNSDILSSIIADPGASPTEIIDQMITFLGAGHETTATSIAWVTHLLTLPENKHYQTTLRTELADIDYSTSPLSLEPLPWLNAICEETLRLFPPVTTTGRIARRHTTIAGNYIARGALVTIFPWAINRNPAYWRDAEKFVPERWLDERPDGSLQVNGHGGAESNYCNMTFLHGNRSCIGKTFAKAELRLTIAELFGRFEVSRLPGDYGRVNPVGSITIKPENGLWVTLREVE